MTPSDQMAAAAGNIQIKSFFFPFQSYFDNTAGVQAIGVQPVGEPIVPSTVQIVPVSGYGIGLHPDSECPVAVRFKSGAGVTDSQVLVLTPGHIVFPNGRAPFSGFTCGLPFGWLGGGVAQLVILKTPDAHMLWDISPSEVVIQRQRVIVQAQNISQPTFSLGLPTGFPWVNAKRYNPDVPTAPFLQGAPAIITATPTRTVLRLRLNGQVTDANVLMLVQLTTPFDTGTALPPRAPVQVGMSVQTMDVGADTVAIPFHFPKLVGSRPYFPTASFSTPDLGNGTQSPGVLLAGDQAVFCLTSPDAPGGAVDIVRYGLI